MIKRHPWMSLGRIIALCVFLLAGFSADAEAQDFQCGPPKGKRVDLGDVYDLQGNPLNSIGEGPRWDDDGFSNMRPTLSIDDSTMRVVWGDAVPSNLLGKVEPKSSVIEIPITHRDAVSVSGMTTYGVTVDLFRYYFHYNALFRLMSSFAIGLQPSDTLPAMAAVYVARCEQVR
jgi:hypothetical protein